MKPKPVDLKSDAELAYELSMMVAAICEGFSSNPDKHWFSLIGACKQFIGVADVKISLRRLGYMLEPYEHVAFLRLLANALRAQGLYVSDRLWLSGKLQTTVWRTDKAMSDYYRERNALDSGTRTNPVRTEYDLQREWKMK